MFQVRLHCEDRAYIGYLTEYLCLHHGDILQLSDREDAVSISVGEAECDISMYRKASAVCGEILRICSEQNRDIRIPDPGRSAELISFISFSSREKKEAIGKYSESLVSEMKKVLYLCPDFHLTTLCPFSGKEERDFSELYYHITRKDRPLGHRLESLAGYDEIRQVHYIRNLYLTPDAALSEEEMGILIGMLKSNTTFDHILLDIPLCMTQAYLALVEASNRTILILSRSDPRCPPLLRILAGREIRNLEQRDVE